jgi:hypothetical protein
MPVRLIPKSARRIRNQRHNRAVEQPQRSINEGDRARLRDMPIAVRAAGRFLRTAPCR